MRIPKTVATVAGGLVVVAALWAFQRPFRQYATWMYDDFPLPPDYQEKTEFVFGRLMYQSYGRGFRGGGSWTTDYPRSDRHFVEAVRRLSRVHTRSVEQPVNLDEGDQYDWPWLYAVEVGRWYLSDSQAKGLREYLLRGGFLMVDDFHGEAEWQGFMASMRRVFPDRPVVDIDNADQIFHVIYDLDDRYQIPGQHYEYSHRTYERYDGTVAYWRGIYDDHGRLMVAICFNSDLGDAWEWADYAPYPHDFAALAMRIGINYVVYAMTH